MNTAFVKKHSVLCETWCALWCALSTLSLSLSLSLSNTQLSPSLSLLQSLSLDPVLWRMGWAHGSKPVCSVVCSVTHTHGVFPRRGADGLCHRAALGMARVRSSPKLLSHFRVKREQLERFDLNVKEIVWIWLSCMCHIRSAVGPVLSAWV